MEERIENSRAGLPVASVRGRALHSRYDPRKEAEKFVESLSPAPDTGFFILIEPGLGYLIPALREKFPGAGICALHASAFLAERQNALFPGVACWPGEDAPAENLQAFLSRTVPDIPAARIKLVEWRPALDAFGESCLSLMRNAAEFLRRLDAETRSTAFFGRRWVKNVFRNLSLIRKTVLPPRTEGDRPWIVAAAGPSLEDCAEEILRLRERTGAAVLAVSAALPALEARGIKADLVLATDGGSWGAFHLHSRFRAGEAPGARNAGSTWEVPPAPLAFALSAALPSQCAGLPLLPAGDHSLWQECALAGAGIPHALLPARGTVSASAIDLALALSRGPVIAAGMDFAVSGTKSHARPYALESFGETGAARFRPACHAAFRRALLLAEGGSYRVYADWFRNQLEIWPSRVFSLSGGHPLFAGRFVSAEDPRAGSGRRDRDAPAFPVAEKTFPPGGTAAWGAAEAIGKALSEKGENAERTRVARIRAARLRAELSALLFPEEPELPAERIREEIFALAEKYGGTGNF